MGKWDHGLGVIGLLLLTAALAFLLTVGIPITVSKDTVELKDWFGFAGNVLGAFAALLAAVIAWRAVQLQIGVQREANLLSVLTREETRIENEIFALDVCIEFLMTVDGVTKANKEAANSLSNLNLYIKTLASMGVVPYYIEMRRSIQQKVNSEISPTLSLTVTSACADLMMAAMDVRDLYESNVPPDGLEPAEQDWIKARGALVKRQEALGTFISELSDLQRGMVARCSRFRTRIEAALETVDSL
jgi:hypothetical protein